MMSKILNLIKKIIPKKVFKLLQPTYHYTLSLMGALVYRFPAKELIIIGVTGTKGKTSVTEFNASILRAAGHTVAISNTIHFQIADNDRKNKYKMSMPGRFFMQKFLRDAIKGGCTHAVVEITSEGAKQFRHNWIWTDILIFTNLHPEHIESHGSFEKYKNAKLSIVKNLKHKKGLLLVNKDDKHSEDFVKKHEGKSVEFGLDTGDPHVVNGSGIIFNFDNTRIQSNLRGNFSLYNMLAAASATACLGISNKKIKEGIESTEEILGREQEINNGQNFKVVIDYAHTPESLRSLYEAYKQENKICVLGNAGGGRDTWKRPKMAKIAHDYCDQIFLTNEDPYDENPEQIIKEMTDALPPESYKIIMDRREAIKKACQSAEENDVVLISGKGTDPYIMGPNGSKTPWSDAEVAREVLIEIKTENKTK